MNSPQPIPYGEILPAIVPPASQATSSVADIPSQGQMQGVAAVAGWLGWLSEKTSETEKALKAREQMAATYRSGTNAQWNAAAAMHPSTAGRTCTKGERLIAAASNDRIAEKFRRDLAMLKAIAAALSQPNNSGQTAATNAAK